MKKITNKDTINILVLISMFLLILFCIIRFDYVNGSTIDWDSQHWIFPEYFRTLFYDTKDMFPSFAFNIGAGQNIFNLSYYGLLSPMVLLSYLFPFVKMVNYVEIYMIAVIILSIGLMYYFLKNKFDSRYSFIGTFLFLMASPLIYHTHRHIMFVSYIPFLIMALIGVDNYFDKGKRTLLTGSVFLIIMSSYYYSVTSIVAIILYGVYRYININKKVTFMDFIKDGLKFIFPIVVGIMMSSVLVLPAFYAVINSRPDIVSNIDIFNLFIPKININEILYHAYSIGVTSIFVIAIIYSFFTKDKQYKFLSIIFILILLFPIIMYALSGFMYVRGKVLIPLIPLAILIITLFLEKFNFNKNKLFNCLIVVVTMIQIFIHIKGGTYVFILDVFFIFISIFISLQYKNKNYIVYSTCICAFICCLVNNYCDELVTKEDIALQYNTYNYNVLNPIIENDANIYRVGNDIMGMKNINRVINSNYYLPSIYSSLENKNYYNTFINNIGNEMENRISTAIMPTKNILFNTYTSTKYMITNKSAPIGYKLVENSNVYINENVLPIGYATTNIMSRDFYNSLAYPEKEYALVTNVIVDEELKNEYKEKVMKEDIKYNASYKYLDIKYEIEKYMINSEEEGKLILDLSKSYKNKLLFITFDMEYSEDCSVGDTSITINDVKNTLSCNEWNYNNNNYSFNYVISSNEEINKLVVEFTKGKYVISNINVYSLDYKYITDFVSSVDEFKIDKEKTKGDIIVGDINVSENGYFVLSVPYEERGFTIFLDDKMIEYDKINDTFIGFKINEGYHKIKIMYTAPYLFEGMIVSILGHMIFLPIIYSDILSKRKKCKKC